MFDYRIFKQTKWATEIRRREADRNKQKIRKRARRKEEKISWDNISKNNIVSLRRNNFAYSDPKKLKLKIIAVQK